MLNGAEGELGSETHMSMGRLPTPIPIRFPWLLVEDGWARLAKLLCTVHARALTRAAARTRRPGPVPPPCRIPRPQVRTATSALVGVMSDAVHCYGGKGGATRQYSLQQPAPILCMQLLATHTSRMVKALIVALANGGRVRMHTHGRI